MTEAEFVELIQNATSFFMTSFAIWLSIVSAYLIAAYAVGRNLTALHTVIIGVLYIVCSSLFTALTLLFITRILNMLQAKVEMFPTGVWPVRYDALFTQYALLGLAFIMVGGLWRRYISCGLSPTYCRLGYPKVSEGIHVQCHHRLILKASDSCGFF